MAASKQKEIGRPTEDKKDAALADAIKQIEKQFGKGAVMRLGDRADLSVDVIPTGSLALDLALGIGGYPKGRIIEIYGPESSGKTTLTLHAIAEIQKKGGRAAFIDAEHALDPVYAKNIGVDIDNLYISQPDSGEQALEITETMVRSGAVDIIIVDSVAALVPKAEIDGDMGDSHVGLQARLMSQALRKLTPVVSKNNCIVIFINQLRENGMEKKEAIITAGRTRIRPVLMTALTTILALSTMAFSDDMGADMSKPMSVVTIGGLVYGTLLTLVVIPCIYDIFMWKKGKTGSAEGSDNE